MTEDNEECKALAIRDCDRDRFAFREKMWAIRQRHFYSGNARRLAAATIAGSLNPAKDSEVLGCMLRTLFSKDPIERSRNAGRMQGWLLRRMMSAGGSPGT